MMTNPARCRSKQILKSLTWHSLLGPAGRRLRRRAPGFASFAAEVLEARQLLSGTVNVVQVGSALTLTADANGSAGSTPTFAIHRISPTTVQVDDDGSGTLIAMNGAFGAAGAAQTFAISSVSSIIVNLGSGYDTFSMYDLSTTGSVTINGRGAIQGGALGADVEIDADSAPVTIGGSIIANLGQQNSTSDNSLFYVFADGASLTVTNSITVTESGAAMSDVEVFNQSGNLTVGSVSYNQSGAGDKYASVESFTLDGPGDVLVKGAITVNQSGSGESTTFELYTFDGGNVTVNGLVAVSESGLASHIINVYSDDGALTLNSSLMASRADAGASYMVLYIYADAESSPIWIKGSVSFIDLLGRGHDEFDINNDVEGSPITIGSAAGTGNVTFNNAGNTASHDDLSIFGSNDFGATNAIVTIKGALTLNLARTASTSEDGQGFDRNIVYLGDVDPEDGDVGYGLIVNGLTSITGGNGKDDIFIEEARLKLGAVINTLTNPGPGSDFADYLEIDGSLFGGGVLVTMAGPSAQIDINNGNGFLTTEFMGPFLANMFGSHPLIIVADGSGAGFSAVKFDSIVTILGSFGGGGIFEFDPARVTFFSPLINPLLINFKKVVS